MAKKMKLCLKAENRPLATMVYIRPKTAEQLHNLHLRTGIPRAELIERIVDFALEHCEIE